MRVAVIQNNAGADVQCNLSRLDDLLAQVDAADLVVLPEVCGMRGNDDQLREAAESVGGMIVSRMVEKAREMRCWLVVGSITEVGNDGVIYNTMVVLDRAGKVAATYRKIHLFEAGLDEGVVVREADLYCPGDELKVVGIDEWTVGLAICFDIRFPEMFQRHRAHGAELLLIPSNFARETGKGHWETLARARAIENQCYVVAPNQCGSNVATGIESYGNSLIVGPWGEVLCRAGEDEAVLEVELDRMNVESVRRKMPIVDTGHTGYSVLPRKQGCIGRGGMWSE